MIRNWLIFFTWLAAFLRLRALFANHFHADEALFASWARLIAVWRDPLLQTQLVDKPPLLFYSQALFYPLLGAVEWAARLPNWIASLLLIPLVGIMAWHWYRDAKTAVLAAALIALSPLAIQFSATAFIDPLLTFLLLLAITFTSRSRPGWAGLLFGLAVTAKYQAFLFLPFILGLALMAGWRRRQAARWITGCAAPLLLLLIWELARSSQPVLWRHQMQNFGGVRLIWSWELWPRAAAWLQQGQYLWGGWLSAGLFLAALLALWRLRPSSEDKKTTAVSKLLLLFLAAYGLLHWLLAVPVWDRYLLPILPLTAILCARGWGLLAGWLAQSLARRSGRAASTRWITAGLIMALLVLLLPAAEKARNGRFPVGGQPDADQGASEVAAFLADEPYGTVLYDHWYSWQWRYHLFDKRVYVSWFPHAAALTADVAAFHSPEQARYIVLPAAAVSQPIQRALETAGFKLTPVFHSQANPGIILFQIDS